MTIKLNDNLPPAPADLTENSPDAGVTFPTEGKIIIVGVPGAFTPPCSNHVPGYVELYDKFLEKGVKEIYVVCVNDIFCVNAWKNHLLSSKGEKPHLHFLADRSASYVKSLGLSFDASGLLGNERAQRFVIVVENGKVASDIRVEANPPDIDVTKADNVLASL